MSTNALILNLIVSLHHRGFVNDIELAGNEFFCVQQKAFVKFWELSILEWHKLYEKGRKKKDVIVLGLWAEPLGVKGILIVDFRNAPSKPIHLLVNRFNQYRIESSSTFEFAIN